MATRLLFKRAALLVKVETSEGVDAAPSASTDAILCENVRINLSPNVIETNEHTDSLDPSDPIVGGTSVVLEFDVWLKGSGAAATPPEWGELLKICGFAETITSTAVPASAEALAAGASAVQATLGASAAGTAQAYRGMPISFSSGVTLASFIWDYSAAKLAKLTDTASGVLTTSSNYQIPVNVLYLPASSSISSGTLWFYNDGILYKLTGGRGNVSFDLTSGGPAKMSVRLMAMFGSKTDTSLVTPTLDQTVKPIWKAGAFTINSVAAALGSLTMDLGGQLVQPDNPNAAEGFDPAVITRRNPKGTMNPYETLVGTRDIMADFRAQTKRPLHARLGASAGNRLGFTIPSALYLNEQREDRQGITGVSVPFHMTGQDSGVCICSY